MVVGCGVTSVQHTSSLACPASLEDDPKSWRFAFGGMESGGDVVPKRTL